MKQPIIKTKHFTLRPFKIGDAESVAENVNDKNIYRNTLVIPYPYFLKDAKQWLRKLTKNQRRKILESVTFAIEIDGQAVGSISINEIKQEHKAEIGYWLGEKYQGKGIMTQVIKEMTRYGFRKLKLRRIYAQVFLFNKRSMRVLEKNGYKFEGMLKKEARKDNKFLDCCVFAKTRSANKIKRN